MAISRLSETTLQTGFQKFNTLWDGRSAVSAIDGISGVILSSSASSITFSNIPQTYSHLQLRMRGTGTTNMGIFVVRFNGDTGGNYRTRILYGDATNVTSGYTSISPNGLNGTFEYAYGTYHPTSVMDIYEYSSSTKYKTMRTIDGTDRNGTGDIEFGTGVWKNQSAVTTITISPQYASGFAANSYFGLFGVK